MTKRPASLEQTGVAVPLANERPMEGTEQRLIEAAVEIFGERGYEGARVQDIAERAGLTTGAIYGRFKGKAGLLAEALMVRSGSDVRQVSAAIASEVPGEELFRVLGRRLVTQPIMPRNSLVLDAIAAARRDPALAEVLRKYVEELGGRLAAHLERTREEGGIDPDLRTETLTYFCLSLIFGAVTLKTLGIPAPDEGEWGRIVDRLVGVMSPGAGHLEQPRRRTKKKQPANPSS